MVTASSNVQFTDYSNLVQTRLFQSAASYIVQSCIIHGHLPNTIANHCQMNKVSVDLLQVCVVQQLLECDSDNPDGFDVWDLLQTTTAQLLGYMHNQYLVVLPLQGQIAEFSRSISPLTHCLE